MTILHKKFFIILYIIDYFYLIWYTYCNYLLLEITAEWRAK